jgi:2-hydroxymuconate-semialdehyde hydrolase
MQAARFCRWCEEAVQARRLGWFGRHILLDGEPIHCVEAGSGEPLLLVHGLGAWSFSWRKVLEPLSRSVRTIVPDLRGFGLSDKTTGGFSVDEQASLLLRLMDTLGIERAVFCGHSFGGEVSMRVAMRAPARVRGLVLVCSGGYVRKWVLPGEPLMQRWPALSGWIARFVFLNRRFVRRALRGCYFDPACAGEDAVEGYLLPAQAPGAPAAFVRMIRSIDPGSHASRIPTIPHPALVIWGENDPWIPLSHGERLARDLPEAELAVIPRCGHAPQEEHPDQFTPLVLRFLARLHGEEQAAPGREPGAPEGLQTDG